MLKNKQENTIYDIGNGFPMQFKVVRNFNRRQHTTALELSKIAFKGKYVDDELKPTDVNNIYATFDETKKQAASVMKPAEVDQKYDTFNQQAVYDLTDIVAPESSRNVSGPIKKSKSKNSISFDKRKSTTFIKKNMS